MALGDKGRCHDISCGTGFMVALSHNCFPHIHLSPWFLCHESSLDLSSFAKVCLRQTFLETDSCESVGCAQLAILLLVLSDLLHGAT